MQCVRAITPAAVGPVLARPHRRHAIVQAGLGPAIAVEPAGNVEDVGGSVSMSSTGVIGSCVRGAAALVAVSLVLGAGPVSQPFLPPAHADEGAPMTAFERRKAEMQQRRELLAKK